MQNNFDAIKIKIIRQESTKRSLSNREKETHTERDRPLLAVEVFRFSVILVSLIFNRSFKHCNYLTIE